MKLQTKVGAAGKKKKGLLFWGNLGDRCGNIEAKIFQSLACLGKDFQVTSPPKNICVSVFRRHLTLFFFQKHLNDEASN
jgi:hypothetical protein